MMLVSGNRIMKQLLWSNSQCEKEYQNARNDLPDSITLFQNFATGLQSTIFPHYGLQATLVLMEIHNGIVFFV